MTHTQYPDWREPEVIQAEVNALLLPALSGLSLDDLTSYLESLEKELKALPKRIRAVKIAINANLENFPDHEIKYFAPLTIESLPERSPMEMLRAEYKGMRLGDIAAKVLGGNPSPLTTTELTRLIYDTGSDDEFNRARNSLSTELRVGAKGDDPKWRKVGRYAYSRL